MTLTIWSDPHRGWGRSAGVRTTVNRYTRAGPTHPPVVVDPRAARVLTSGPVGAAGAGTAIPRWPRPPGVGVVGRCRAEGPRPAGRCYRHPDQRKHPQFGKSDFTESAAASAFDPRVTPSSWMGAVAETVQTWPDAVRSAHPQTSFVALGPRATEITECPPLDCRLGEAKPTRPAGGGRSAGAAGPPPAANGSQCGRASSTVTTSQRSAQTSSTTVATWCTVARWARPPPVCSRSATPLTKERYDALHEHFAGSSLAGVGAMPHWVDDAIRFDGRTWPMVRMEWINGRAMHQHVEQLVENGDTAALGARPALAQSDGAAAGRPIRPWRPATRQRPGR